MAAAYQEGVTQGATAIGLVVLLQERLIQDMRCAVAAMEGNQTEDRVAHINHAFMILQYLQGTLDFQHGRDLAIQLEHFYNHVRAKLLEAQIQNSKELLAQQINDISEVRDCWVQAESRTSGSSQGAPIVAGPSSGTGLPESAAGELAEARTAWQA